MKLDIISDKNNPLLDRREISFKIEASLTPSRPEIKDALAEQAKVSADLLVIDKVSQLAGSHTSMGYAKVYDSPEALKNVELEHLTKRGVKKKPEGEEAPAEAAPAAEAPAEAAPAAEAPAEGAASEAPAETAPEAPAEEAPKEEAPAEEAPAEEKKEEPKGESESKEAPVESKEEESG